ncbi:MAG: alpha/beta hydrolase [Oscillospiraceae bacterium]|nr:alpha/beta hydrolase [Oscillospiraceae bacterium]
MKISKSNFLTFVTLSGISVGIIHLINRFVSSNALSTDILKRDVGNIYDWDYGKICYQRFGSGRPLLLIHDLSAGGNSFEWSKTVDYFAEDHCVYVVDLPGCGKSEKKSSSYVNYFFVRMLRDFVKDIIGEKTDVIVNRFSCSFALIAAQQDPDHFGKLVLLNPVNIKAVEKDHTPFDTAFKKILELPVIGTFIYYMMVSKENVTELIADRLLYNPFYSELEELVDSYYEASHYGGYTAKYLYASLVSGYLNVNLSHFTELVDNDVLILVGEDPKDQSSANAYQDLNPEFDIQILPETCKIPHLERPEAFCSTVGSFLKEE